MKRPLVDVGIPTHGRPQYLRETVESVMAQTFDSWRLTISENGPGRDDLKAILEPYLVDPRVHHVATGSEISAAGNATRAIRAGSAPYVALLHDDDRWNVGFLSRRVSFLEANPACGLVFSHCNFIGRSGATVFRLTVDLREGMQPRKESLRALYLENIIRIPTVLSRRSAYDAVGPAFSESVLFYDYEMWLRIAARFDIGFLDVCDASYRIHPAQTTRQETTRVGEHRLELLDEVDRWLPADFPSVERRRARSGAHLRAAFDAFERRERRRSVAHLVRAFREYPAAPVDPKMRSLVMGALRNRARQRELWMVEPKTE